MTKRKHNGYPELPPRRKPLLPVGRFWDFPLPIRVQRARSMTDEGVWTAAVNAFDNMIDPATGRPLDGRPVDELALGALAQTAAQCKQYAAEQSEIGDATALQAYADADNVTATAVDMIEHTGKVMDEPVDGPDGARITARELVATHDQDKMVAAHRSQEGDSRHRQRKVEHAWVVITALALGFLDVFLLWKPVLSLGFLGSADMLIKWMVGVAFAVAQALFIERALGIYARDERACHDRRAAISDYNRRLRLVDRSEPDPDPDLVSVSAADRKFVTATRWLLAAALFTSVVAAVRVALLAAASGLPVVETAVFASVVGLVLGGLVVLLALACCRGNLLGDRLRWGAQAVTDVEERVQAGRAQVADQRELARRLLNEGDGRMAWARETRELVVGDYEQAMLLACSWAGADRDNLAKTEFVPRALPVAEQAKKLCAEVEARLAEVETWLADRPTLNEVRQPLALESGQAPGKELAVRPNQPHFPIKKLPSEPGTSPWLIVACAVIAIFVAITAAVVAPVIEDTAPGALAPPVAAAR